MTEKSNIIIAFPKGRILQELSPLLKTLDVCPEESFFDENSRALSFSTNRKNITFIRVRSFDVATFVAFGAAHLGISGNDVLLEFDYPDLYSPLDLGIGKCRMALAAPKDFAADEAMWNESHIRVATKYTNITKKFFASRGIQAECVKLNGAVELAPKLGLSQRIVDLVSSGATLKANGLVEVETIVDVSSRLIVNRGAFKTMGSDITALVDGFAEAVHGKVA